MARIRSIKPEFPQSEHIGRLSRDARLCFIQLWTLVDDEGRHRASSRLLASLLFPYDDDALVLMDSWLDQLEAAGFVVRYEVDGSRYLQVQNWKKHQKIDHPSKSHIPPFATSSESLARARETLAPDLVPRIVGPSSDDAPSLRSEASSRGAKSDPSDRDALTEFTAAYPKDVNPDAVKRELTKRLKAGVDFDEILAGARRAREKAVGQDPKFVKAPDKWLADGCWRDGQQQARAGPKGPQQVRVARDSDQGRAWEAHVKATTGKPAKWILDHTAAYFPTEWPPGHQHAQAAE